MANPGQDSTSETKAAKEAALTKAKKEEDIQAMA
jgi:hypothetical protein